MTKTTVPSSSLSLIRVSCAVFLGLLSLVGCEDEESASIPEIATVSDETTIPHLAPSVAVDTADVDERVSLPIDDVDTYTPIGIRVYPPAFRYVHVVGYSELSTYRELEAREWPRSPGASFLGYSGKVYGLVEDAQFLHRNLNARGPEGYYEHYYPITKEQIRVGADGYSYYSGPGFELVFVEGEGYFIDHQIGGARDLMTSTDHGPLYAFDVKMARSVHGVQTTRDFRQAFIENRARFDERDRSVDPLRSDPIIVDDGIESLEVPSELKEQIAGETVTYHGSNMRLPFAGLAFLVSGDRPEHLPSFDLSGLPWVENEPGPGRGVVIDIRFVEPTDNLVVLNGFVDLRRRHLYKANARMRSVAVSGDGFEIEYVFEDSPSFQKIVFPAKTERVSLTVNDVYEGERFEDLAIRAVFTESVDSVPFDQYIEELQQWVRSEIVGALQDYAADPYRR